jgi:hypothetical protein
MIVLSIESSSGAADGKLMPQYGQKASASVTDELHSGHVTDFSACNLLNQPRLANYMKPQEGFSYDDLVTLSQNLRTARQKAPAAIEERAVRRTEIFDHVNISAIIYPGMASRNLCVRVVGVEIDIREDPVVGVPAADVRFLGGQLKFGISRIAAFDDKTRVSAAAAFRFDLLALLGEFKRLFDYRRHAHRRYLRRSLAGVADLGWPET